MVCNFQDTEVVKSEPTDVSFVAPEPKRFYVRPDQVRPGCRPTLRYHHIRLPLSLQCGCTTNVHEQNLAPTLPALALSLAECRSITRICTHKSTVSIRHTAQSWFDTA